jgi:hypothetical protein
MSYYLFLDNFRGFTDTCIPITDVNFLVGENSTGKSSILGLMKMLSGPGLFLGNVFSDEDVGFNHFLDMVSVNAQDQSYFRVGFVSDGPQKKNGPNAAIGCLFTFQEKQGQPRPFKCTFMRDQVEITIKFGTTVYCKQRQHAASLTSKDMISILRSDWVNEHSRKENGYKRLAVPTGFGGRIPLVLALSLAGKTPKKGGELTFSPEDFLFSPPDVIWFGPIRTKPRRTYDELSVEFSPEGRHTPYLIRRMLRSRAAAIKLKEFIDKVGKASGLFQGVEIKSFGRGATARFELDIVLDGKALNILNVGYGVSQSLPIMVELLARPPGTWFAIQEPEIHLHPRAQAALGEVLFEMAAIDRKRFLVETHSDFAIDRFRMKYREGTTRQPKGQVLFFERRDKHNVVTPLAIGKDGELPVDQPENYRSFFVREQMNLLGI